MVKRSTLIWQIFQMIEDDNDGRALWNLLEQISTASDGLVYMTYAGETPEALAHKLGRQRLVKLIQLHHNMTHLRRQLQD